MKKKPPQAQAPLIPREILEQARQSWESDKLKRPAKCPVCGAETAPSSSEGLCWVCRRLKISAWRDQDHQLPASE